MKIIEFPKNVAFAYSTSLFYLYRLSITFRVKNIYTFMDKIIIEVNHTSATSKFNLEYTFIWDYNKS